MCAIYPNANGFGFVYLDNEGLLIYYGSVRINPISNWKILERIKKSLDYFQPRIVTVSYTHLRAHETVLDIVCRLLLEKKKTH